MILELAVSRKWNLHQVDVNNSFLNGELVEDIYMKQPPSFEVFRRDGTPLAYLLNKDIYGLKQASRVWSEKLRGFRTQSLKFHISRADTSLFFKHSLSGHVFIDIIITSDSCLDLMKSFKVLIISLH